MGQQQRAGGVGAARSVYHLQRCPCHRPCQPVPFWGSASCSGCSEPMPPTPAVSSESRASPAQDLARFPGRGARQGSHPCPPLPIASSISSKQLPGIAPTTQVHPRCPPRRRQALLVPAARQQHHQPHLPQSQAEAACGEQSILPRVTRLVVAVSRSHPSLLGKMLPAWLRVRAGCTQALSTGQRSVVGWSLLPGAVSVCVCVCTRPTCYWL